MPAAKQRTLRIPDAVWELLNDAAAERAVGVAELMVEATLSDIARRLPAMRERVEAARDVYRRRGLKVRV
jgi:hypothetical protein